MSKLGKARVEKRERNRFEEEGVVLDFFLGGPWAILFVGFDSYWWLEYCNFQQS